MPAFQCSLQGIQACKQQRIASCCICWRKPSQFDGTPNLSRFLRMLCMSDPVMLKASCTVKPKAAVSCADNMWYSEHMAKASSHPNQASPQCVPCNYTKDVTQLRWPMPRGCPCRPEDLCNADKAGTFSKHGRPCGMPRCIADVACSLLRPDIAPSITTFSV